VEERTCAARARHPRFYPGSCESRVRNEKSFAAFPLAVLETGWRGQATESFWLLKRKAKKKEVPGAPWGSPDVPTNAARKN